MEYAIFTPERRNIATDLFENQSITLNGVKVLGTQEARHDMHTISEYSDLNVINFPCQISRIFWLR